MLDWHSKGKKRLLRLKKTQLRSSRPVGEIHILGTGMMYYVGCYR